MPIRIASLIGAALLVAACAGADPVAPSAGPEPRATGDGTSTSSPAAGTDCGTIMLDLGERLPDDAAQCFIDAVAARTPARLQLTRPTDEGDPIPVTYVAGAGGTVEVTTDTTEDAFGPREVRRESCTGPRLVHGGLEFSRCIPST